jgi:hypothetical protein
VNHKYFSEALFLQELLSAAGHGYGGYKNKRELLDRLTRMYATAARNCGGNRVVLVIDEAQDLEPIHFRQFVAIENELNILGYSLCIVFIGTHELGYVHNLTISSGATHISGRYLVRHSRFRGIRSIDELKAVLESYDARTEWPEQSHVSFTKYFFPGAFEEGFRVLSCAETMWQCYEKWGLDKDRYGTDVPMEHIARAVEYMYRCNSDHDLVREGRISDERVADAIQSTGYLAHMIAVGDSFGDRLPGGAGR